MTDKQRPVSELAKAICREQGADVVVIAILKQPGPMRAGAASSDQGGPPRCIVAHELFRLATQLASDCDCGECAFGVVLNVEIEIERGKRRDQN
jgi:hypothetical protein